MPSRKKAVSPKWTTNCRQTAVELERTKPESAGSLLLQAHKAIGVPNAEAATILVAQAAGMPATRTDAGPESARAQVQIAVNMLEQIKPEGALQAMLATQMIGVHNTAVKFLMRAADESRTLDMVDVNVLRATRLMRLFKEQLEALAGLRGKTSEQKVTVEHVHVHEGGQAFVGNLTRNGEVPPRGQGEGNAN
jgi:hypothetical protein